MGFGGSSQNQPLIAAGLNIDTSTNVLPVSVLWGTNRIAPNLIWAADFQYHQQSSGGGGSGGGGKGSGQSYYSASIIMALCEGPISGVTEAWLTSTAITWANYLSQYAVELFDGTRDTQTTWSYLVSNWPSQELGYPGTAFIAGANYNLGGSPSPPNHNFLVQGPLYGTATWTNGDDADFAEIIFDFLTNAYYGIAGFPTGSIDQLTLYSSGGAGGVGDAAMQTYLRAVGIAASPLINSQERGNSVLKRWADICNTQIAFYDGKMKFIPYGDTVITANGVTYRPNVTPYLTVGNSDFVVEKPGEEPVTFELVPPEEVFNVVRVECNDYGNQYSPLPVEARDQNGIETTGFVRIMPSFAAHELTRPAIAQIVGQLMLQRQLFIRLKPITFKVSWDLGCQITPGDIITLDRPEMGYGALQVRIVETVEDASGVFTITAEEFSVGTATGTAYNAGSSSPNSFNSLASPGPVNVPVIFEPNSSLVTNAAVWLSVSGGIGGVANAAWGGCYVWASTDGSTYGEIGQVLSPAIQGTLTASLPGYTGSNPDNTNTLSINLNESNNNTLATVPATVAAAGTSLCYVDGELLSYTTATLTTINYQITEYWNVPASNTVIVNSVADYVSNVGVTYSPSGTPLTLVGSSPGVGQYTESAGVYGFNSADDGQLLAISYVRSGPGYNLTGLYRNLYGTSGASGHASGSLFSRLDTSTTKISLPNKYIDVYLYLKFQSYNIYGSAVEDLSTCVVYNYTPTGAGFYNPSPLFNAAGANLLNSAGVSMNVNLAL